jgi:hypothetical protein
MEKNPEGDGDYRNDEHIETLNGGEKSRVTWG